MHNFICIESIKLHLCAFYTGFKRFIMKTSYVRALAEVCAVMSMFAVTALSSVIFNKKEQTK